MAAKHVPRILLLSHSAGWGGAEKCLALLLEGLPRETFEPLVLMRRRPLPWRRPAGLESHCRRLGIAHRLVDLRWWARDWPHDRAFAAGLADRVHAVARVIRQWRPDAVLSNTSVVPEGALAAAACGVPHVWHVLELLSRDPALRPFLPLPRLYGLMGELSQRIVAVSAAVRDELAPHIAGDKLAVIHTGLPDPGPAPVIDKTAVLGVAHDTPVVAFVGLLSHRKGVVDLIEAARLVVAAMPQARFVLAGRDGGAAAEVRRLIDRYALGSAVRWLGPRSDVPAILAASDLLVLPSLADPLPVAVLEAISFGLPVAATRSGGCEEMVADGETGLLVPPGDRPALAAAILRLLGDPATRAAMGARGRARFLAEFTQAGYVERFARLIEETIAAGLANPLAPRNIGPVLDELRAAACRRAEQRRRSASLAQRLHERLLTLLYRCRVVR